MFVVAPGLRGQSDATDADLENASDRLVAVGTLGGGRTITLPLEVYVARVLAGEGEPNAPEATQQALAIAIRTYALFNQGRHRRDGFDLCDSTHCQVVRTSTAASRRAARATAGLILTYRGAPAEIFYSASCGGRSEAAADIWPTAALPYLRSVDDDVHDQDEPWTRDLAMDAIETTLHRNGFDGELRNLEVESRTRSGRVARLRLSGMRPDAITGDQFRMFVGPVELRSTAFDVERRGQTLRFTGRGFGHGVGMCVIGAGRRARRGETVEQILAQYYPGLTITTLSGPPPVTSAAAAAPAAPTELEAFTARVQESLSMALGVSAVPANVRAHQTIDSFRAATGRSWWAGASVNGSTIDLAPPAVLAQRGGLEVTVRTAVAEMLLRTALPDRPAWVIVGGARFFAAAAAPGTARPVTGDRVRCPADAELTFAVSAAAQREAEARAETCFARAFAAARDWRMIR